MSWIRNQANRIVFVMVDSNGSEVAGIGNGNLTVEISKNGSAFAPGAGTDTEVGDGWYSYLATAGEADTIGAIAVKVDGAGAVQQNLEYVVQQRNASCVSYTYTVTDGANPIDGAEIWITTDISGNNVIWNGTTDALGIARDENNNLPCLDAGTYYFWKQLGGYIDNDNPDTEVVS